MKQITCSKDQVIFRQGDSAATMFDIQSGKVGIFTDYQTEREERIAQLDAGQLFGEMGVIEFYPRSATAVALDDNTVLVELEEGDLAEYLKDKPEKLLQVMRQLSHRIRETTQNYVDVCRTVSERERAEKEKDLEAKIKARNQMNNYAAFYTMNWMH